MKQTIRKFLAVAAVGAAGLAATGAAQARSDVFWSIGINLPPIGTVISNAPGYHHYPAPAVVYAPPPVVYAPPPRVVYRHAPVVVQAPPYRHGHGHWKHRGHDRGDDRWDRRHDRRDDRRDDRRGDGRWDGRRN
jgi:hypothetical protein